MLGVPVSGICRQNEDVSSLESEIERVKLSSSGLETDLWGGGNKILAVSKVLENILR